MKRIVALILTLILVLGCGVGTAESYARLKMRISTRTGPGTDYTEPGTFLQKGDYVTVHTKVWDNTNEIWWVQVEFTAGRERYRAYTGAQRLDVNLYDTPEETIITECSLTCQTPTYAGPGTEYHRWQYDLLGGTSVLLYAVEKDYGFIECWNSSEELYWRVWVPLWALDYSPGYLPGSSSSGSWSGGYDYNDGPGYVTGAASHLIGRTCRITASSGSVRVGADASYRQLTTVRYGERYEIYDTATAPNGKVWFLICADGNCCGWISSGITDLNTSSSGSAGSSYQDSGRPGASSSGLVGRRCRITASSANARSGPGTEYSQITTVLRNETYLIYDTAAASNGKTWYRIRTDQGYAWISSGVTKLD